MLKVESQTEDTVTIGVYVNDRIVNRITIGQAVAQSDRFFLKIAESCLLHPVNENHINFRPTYPINENSDRR